MSGANSRLPTRSKSKFVDTPAPIANEPIEMSPVRSDTAKISLSKPNKLRDAGQWPGRIVFPNSRRTPSQVYGPRFAVTNHAFALGDKLIDVSDQASETTAFDQHP